MTKVKVHKLLLDLEWEVKRLTNRSSKFDTVYFFSEKRPGTSAGISAESSKRVKPNCHIFVLFTAEELKARGILWTNKYNVLCCCPSEKELRALECIAFGRIKRAWFASWNDAAARMLAGVKFPFADCCDEPVGKAELAAVRGSKILRKMRHSAWASLLASPMLCNLNKLTPCAAETTLCALSQGSLWKFRSKLQLAAQNPSHSENKIAKVLLPRMLNDQIEELIEGFDIDEDNLQIAREAIAAGAVQHISKESRAILERVAKYEMRGKCSPDCDREEHNQLLEIFRLFVAAGYKPSKESLLAALL